MHKHKSFFKNKLVAAVTKVINHRKFDLNNDSDLNELIEVLDKEQKFRTSSDIDLIRLALQKFQFFQDLESSMGIEHVNHLYKELVYERFSRRKVVFNQGDIGRKFYIILKGTVWILIRKKNQVNEEEENIKEKLQEVAKMRKRRTSVQTKTYTLITEVRKRHEEQAHEEQENEEYPDMVIDDDQFLKVEFPNFEKVGEMISGCSFGEIALQQHSERTATIICSDTCHLASLTRETFTNMLSDYYEQLQEKNLKFLKQVSMFSDWNNPMINQIYYHFTFQESKLNQCIYKEDDPADFIYLIREGEVEISKLIEIKTRQPTDSERLLTNFKIGKRKYNCKYKRAKLAIITPGQMFGQEEVLQNSKRQTMATCLTDSVKLFVLSKHKFLSFCNRGNTIQKVSVSNEQKSEIRSYSQQVFATLEKPPYEKLDLKSERTFAQEILSKKLDDRKDKSLESFVITTIPNVYDRISDKFKYNSFKLLQDKTHQSYAMSNFENYQDSLRKITQSDHKPSLKDGFFVHEHSRSATINILNKIFPGALREEYKIPSVIGRDSKHLVKSLKLAKIVAHTSDQSVKFNLKQLSFFIRLNLPFDPKDILNYQNETR